jgi:microcystin degradation protein MlrC
VRIAIGALMQESNAFCVRASELQDFRNKYLEFGGHVIERLSGTRTEIGGAIAALNEAGVEIVPLIATHGGAGGIVTAACHTYLRGSLLDALAGAGPVDGVFLALHGAMCAEETDDVEGALLGAVRTIVGATPVAVSCDLHGHITPAMIANADVLVGYRHYPHDDAPETAASAVHLLLETIAGRVKPVMALAKAPMLFAPHLEHTFGEGPMVDLDRLARSYERSGGTIQAVSYFPVQPWIDVEGMGFAAVVVADNDEALAKRVASELVESAFARRTDFDVTMIPIDDAIREALMVPGGPIILADTSDCVGGGSTGDGAATLAAILRLACDVPALVHLVDPVVAAEAHKAGKGATLRTAVGNRIDTSRGAPVPVIAKVERIFDGRFTYDGGFLGGVTASMGPSAVLAIGATRVLVASYGSYEWGFEPYAAAHLDVRAAKLVSVKNPMNYRLTYPFAKAAYVLDTNGPATPDLRRLSWRKLKRPFYPLDEIGVDHHL